MTAYAMMQRLFDDAPRYANTSFPPPRPFQQAAHDALRQGFREGHKNQLIMAPTGAGKTYLGHRIAHEALVKHKKVVFVCDRTTLINQTSEAADEYGLSAHGVVQANHWRRAVDMPYQIASAQTIAKRGYWPEADVIIIDEAHTQLKVWTEFVNQTKAACIGLSATPFSPGLGKLFTNLINATTMHDLTQSGVLVPMRVLSCKRADMNGAATSGGEWTDSAAEERGMQIVGDVVKEWIAHGQHRKTIVFGATINHCKELARQFVDAGVMAAVFTSETTEVEREMLRAEFKKPDATLRVLISVEALAKGFDVRDVGCVVDCRPLRKSLSTAIQMWGRGLRASPETGKKDCILLDHSGNITRFAEDFSEVYFHGLEALDMGEKLDKKVRHDDEDREAKGCPSCGYKPFHKRCMSCGFERNEPVLQEAVAGVMEEVVMLGKKKLADDQRHLWAQLCAYARAHSLPSKQRGRAWHLFQKITGQQPPSTWDFDSTPSAEVTANVRNKIKSMDLAFVKARKS
ncbi:DEAD/DEAH box helicase [Comamonas sp. B21-038]|uniref:DEAD/DEAH box helicase n=1 Tax=Comamonas sp. B21-038 TaxID=2918299 RepID=UPI001EFB04A5|nr:DEAD/DEAH box helicase family protein [Comamonas sp. B21-038]ULR87200.1 DEAD/DEAH box helicase family protein [Comamonas sp. B21-038]